MVQCGLTPDPWQADLLQCTDRWMLLLCSRQAGKTSTAAAMCLATALSESEQLNLILSPSEKQSKEIFRVT
jgi:phage terminase large subunit-like protein